MIRAVRWRCAQLARRGCRRKTDCLSLKSPPPPPPSTHTAIFLRNFPGHNTIPGKDDGSGYFDQRQMYGGWNYPGQTSYATVAMNSQFENNRIKYDEINQQGIGGAQPSDAQRHYLMCGEATATSTASDMMTSPGLGVNHQHHQQQLKHGGHHHAPVVAAATQSTAIGGGCGVGGGGGGTYGATMFDPMAHNQVC